MATTNLTNLNRYRAPIAPRLPSAPAEYNQQYIEQLNSILRQYFNQLDGLNTTLVGDDSTSVSGVSSTGVVNTIGPGGRFIRMPYGSFSRNTQQTAAVINTAYAVVFDTTDLSNTVSLVSTTQITAKYAGIYNFQFSVQLENTANASSDVTFWLKKNGTNISASGGLFGMSPRKSAGDYFHLIGGYNVFVSLTAGQYIELYWSTTDTASSIQNYAASGVSPNNIPSSPAVIATMTFVSAPIA
jgi:hypothetical protein